MGCDIHLHVEIKINGQWAHYNHPDISRNYRLFNKLAGVRSYTDEITPISNPRGLPADCSATTRLDRSRWDSDGHSDSWISAAEIAELERWSRDDMGWVGALGRGWWMEDTFGYFFGNSYAGWTQYPDDYTNARLRELGVEDVRFVFWFDN
jgi:hypothetical protein